MFLVVRFLAPTLSVLVAAALSARLGELLPRAAIRWSVLASVACFAVLAALLLGAPAARVTRRTAARVAACMLAFVAIALLLARHRMPVDALVLATFFGAALAEEAVFRAWLPRRLAVAMGDSGMSGWRAELAAVVAAQAIFALGHVLPLSPDSATHALSDLPRLFAIGCLYTLLVRECGVWAAALVHGAMNVAVATHGAHFVVRPEMITVALFASGAVSVGMLLHWLSSRTAMPRRDSPEFSSLFVWRKGT